MLTSAQTSCSQRWSLPPDSAAQTPSTPSARQNAPNIKSKVANASPGHANTTMPNTSAATPRKITVHQTLLSASASGPTGTFERAPCASADSMVMSTSNVDG